MSTGNTNDPNQFGTFQEVRDRPPLSEMPRRIDLSGMWRWHVKGILTADGTRVRLRATRVGRFLYTKPIWVQEFLDATQAGRAQQAEETASRVMNPISNRSPHRRHRDRERAQRIAASI